MITIRYAHSLDVTPLHKLARTTFPLASPPGISASDLNEFIAANLSIENFSQHLSNAKTRILVATHTDTPATPEKLVGYALLLSGRQGAPAPSYNITRSPSIYLSKFYVDAKFHGTTVATTLMNAVRNSAYKDLSGASIWLAVNQLNAKAARFYEKNGFTRVGVKTMEVGSRTFNDYVYELLIPPTAR